MFLWDVAVLELDCHPYNRPDPPTLCKSLEPSPLKIQITI